MTDIVQDAIQTGEIDAGNISFEKLRSIAGKDRGCWSQLGRGRTILCSHDQLDQYLYSYGPMTKSQWELFLPKVTIPKGAVRIIDYGCGQGLAGVLLFDTLGPGFVKEVESVVLVEPSGVALERARAVLGCYLGKRPLVAIQKKLDEITPKELGAMEGANNIHLLSNVLDVEGFQHFELFTKMLQAKGHHSILAVSHNRDFHGGAGRFRQLAEVVSDKKYDSWFTLKTSRIDEFICGNGKQAISWELHIEVLRGSV